MRLFYDFHIHTCLSPCACDDMTPLNIVNMSKLAGLQIIAICDHNSTRNCAAVKIAAERAGIVALPGMELTVRGDVHVLCLFSDCRNADNFCDFVYEHMPYIKNNPDVFGNQLVFDADDNPAGIEQRLLMTAADIDIFDVSSLAASFGGFAVPAHIDRPAFSLLQNLGFYAPEMNFTVAEIYGNAAELKKNRSDTKDLLFIRNSDAHSLNMIRDAKYLIETVSRDPADILDAIKHGKFPRRIK